jgi:hypothetical protein
MGFKPTLNAVLHAVEMLLYFCFYERDDMNERFASIAAARCKAGNPGSKLSLVLLSLAAMVGCQGFSSSKSASVQTATGTLTLSGTALAFGTVTTGTSKTLSISASNTGTASITVSSVSISNQAFLLNAPVLPRTIAAGQSTPISITFAPTLAGDVNATVSVASNASDSSATFSLTGTGVASGQLMRLRLVKALVA